MGRGLPGEGEGMPGGSIAVCGQEVCVQMRVYGVCSRSALEDLIAVQGKMGGNAERAMINSL